MQLLNCCNTALPSVRVFTPEESPLVNPLNAGHSGIAPLPSAKGKPVRFRSIFSGGISPMTPRYGLGDTSTLSTLETVKNNCGTYRSNVTPILHEA